MSTSDEPTGRLRFVERHEAVPWNPDKSGKAGMVDLTRKARVLQQQWRNEIGELYWRDVPFEQES